MFSFLQSKKTDVPTAEIKCPQYYGIQEEQFSFSQMLDGADALPDPPNDLFDRNDQVIEIFLLDQHPQNYSQNHDAENDKQEHITWYFFAISGTTGMKDRRQQFIVQGGLNDDGYNQ